MSAFKWIDCAHVHAGNARALAPLAHGVREDFSVGLAQGGYVLPADAWIYADTKSVPSPAHAGWVVGMHWVYTGCATGCLPRGRYLNFS
jgi:hypothetical protein